MAFEGDPLAYVGKSIIEEHHATLLKQLPPIKFDPNDSSNPFDISNGQLRFLPSLKVGIVGAGVGGLYTALMFDSLGIEYEIIESSGRVGGRVETYHFKGGEKYDYYETGAMRFPLPKKDAQGKYKDGTMKRLAELIEYGPLNTGGDRLKDKLVPYYYTAREGSNPGFNYFNGIWEPVSNKPKGSFDAEGMNVEADYIKAGSDAITSDVVSPFIRMMINDLLKPGEHRGWDVMKANDSYTVRAYMISKYMPSDSLQLPPQHLPSNVVNWCQLFGGFGGGYDRALTEAVFESLAFGQVGGSDYGDVDWKSFDGGSETLPKRMEKYINSTGVCVRFNKRVTSMGRGFMVVSVPKRMINEDTLPSGVEKTDSESVDYVIGGEEATEEAFFRSKLIVPCVKVKVNGTETKNYSHVISTLPLPVLRTIDLTNAGLNTMQKNALRDLDYGPAVKVAIFFKSNWWTTKLGIVGGQSFTDLPIRTIVYPSYGVDSDTPSTVLIASYTWTSDAYRLSALASEKERETLKELVLRNLAEAHSHLSSEITYEYLKDEFVDMNVKDWNQDEHVMGAIAAFYPGEFEDLYTSLNFPAAGNRLHFAGEAISIRHAWVVGALDSAWKAVFQYLKVTKQDAKIAKFKKIWGENVEWASSSKLLQRAGFEGEVPDMLDQHLGLVSRAVQGGVIAQRN